MPIKDQTKAKEYKRLWIARKRQALKKQNVEPVEPSKNKYYSAHNIKVLMSLKEYTELNKNTRKLWYNFILTFQELAKFSFHDIVQIMKLREDAELLIKDYWETAKQEEKQGKSWNSLSDEKQQKLISYWAKERLRQDKNLLTDLDQQERQSKEYLKEIELAKFHEERGKEKCSCYSCQEKKEIQREIKEKVFDYVKQSNHSNKKQCPECGKYVQELHEEHGICSKCVQQYEE